MCSGTCIRLSRCSARFPAPSPRRRCSSSCRSAFVDGSGDRGPRRAAAFACVHSVVLPPTHTAHSPAPALHLNCPHVAALSPGWERCPPKPRRCHASRGNRKAPGGLRRGAAVPGARRRAPRCVWRSSCRRKRSQTSLICPSSVIFLRQKSVQAQGSSLRSCRAGSQLSPAQQAEAEEELDLIARQVADEEALSLPMARSALVLRPSNCRAPLRAAQPASWTARACQPRATLSQLIAARLRPSSAAAQVRSGGHPHPSRWRSRRLRPAGGSGRPREGFGARRPCKGSRAGLDNARRLWAAVAST